MTALLAAHHGPELSLAYLSFGGFSDTASLTTFTRMNNPDLIRNIATPNLTRWVNPQYRYLHSADWEKFKTFRAANIAWLGREAPSLAQSSPESRTLCEGTLTGSNRGTEGICLSHSTGR